MGPKENFCTENTGNETSKHFCILDREEAVIQNYCVYLEVFVVIIVDVILLVICEIFKIILKRNNSIFLFTLL